MHAGRADADAPAQLHRLIAGYRRIVLAINKMDLVEYSQERFAEIERDYRAFAQQIGLNDITAIPLSAVYGDNIIEPGANMPWYAGPTLMNHLETVPIEIWRRPCR